MSSGRVNLFMYFASGTEKFVIVERSAVASCAAFTQFVENITSDVGATQAGKLTQTIEESYPVFKEEEQGRVRFMGPWRGKWCGGILRDGRTRPLHTHHTQSECALNAAKRLALRKLMLSSKSEKRQEMLVRTVWSLLVPFQERWHQTSELSGVHNFALDIDALRGALKRRLGDRASRPLCRSLERASLERLATTPPTCDIFASQMIAVPLRTAHKLLGSRMTSVDLTVAHNKLPVLAMRIAEILGVSCPRAVHSLTRSIRNVFIQQPVPPVTGIVVMLQHIVDTQDQLKEQKN